MQKYLYMTEHTALSRAVTKAQNKSPCVHHLALFTVYGDHMKTTLTT